MITRIVILITFISTAFAMDADAAQKKSHSHHRQKHGKHTKHTQHAKHSKAVTQTRQPAQVLIAKKQESKHDNIDMTVDPNRPLTWDLRN